MSPLFLPKFFKRINLNTKFGSLEHSRLEGYVFSITDENYKSCGSAKKYLYLPEGCSIKFEIVKGICPFGIVFIETHSEVFGYDDGVPEPMNKKVYVIKHNIWLNNNNKNDNEPTVVVECGDKQQFSNYVRINGPSTMIYDPENYHKLGGKVRIETNSEIEIDYTI